MVGTGRFGSHVWSKRVPKLGQAVQVFLRMKKGAPTKPSAIKSRLSPQNPAFEGRKSRLPFSFNSPGDSFPPPSIVDFEALTK